MSASSNARWLILIQVYRVGLQLVGMAVLARLLPPSDYGLMAMAFTATNLANLLRDLGMSSAIIQRQALSERTRSTVFWLHLTLGWVTALVLMSLSGVIAAAFKQPALAGVLFWLALTFPVSSLSAVHQALLERESRFQTLARIEVVASTCAVVVAIVAAYRGAGVYSFVWQSYTVALLYLMQPWLAMRWRPQWVWDRHEIKSLLGYSGNLSAFNLINFLARNADSMIIGRFLGPAALGAYSMAYKLMLFPLQNLTFVASRALFPVMSRKQDSNAELAPLYLRAVAMVASVATPLMAGLHLLREPLSRVMFGSQWGDVPHIIAWLAPVGALQAVIGTAGTVYMAKGRTDLLFRLGAVSALLMIGAFVAGLPRGVVGVASLYFVANLLVFVPQTWLATRLIGLRYARFLRGLLPALVCTAVMIPAVWGVSGTTAALGDVMQLVLSAVAGSLVYAGAYALLFRAELAGSLHAALGSRLPARWRAFGTPPAGPVWLFIDLADDYGGHEVMLLRWMDELRARSQVQSVLVCRADTMLARRAAGHAEVLTVPQAPPGKLGGVRFTLRLAVLLLRLKLRRRPELAVIAEGCLMAQRHGLYAARLAGLYSVLYVPLVSRFASLHFAQADRLERSFRRFYGKLPHAWLTITAQQADEFRAWSGVGQPVYTLPNTVRAEIETAPPLHTASAREERLRVLVFGRLDLHQKGLDLLLDHLQKQPQLATQCTVRFVGDGPFRDTLLEARDRHPHLAGFVHVEPWADAAEVFARSDVLLLPSRYEGVPLVMLEAMALGLPVLASDLAGTRAFLPACSLFPVGRLDLAFACLTTLQRSSTRTGRLARRNRAAFETRASGAAFAAAVDALTARLRHAAQWH